MQCLNLFLLGWVRVGGGGRGEGGEGRGEGRGEDGMGWRR